MTGTGSSDPRRADLRDRARRRAVAADGPREATARCGRAADARRGRGLARGGRHFPRGGRHALCDCREGRRALPGDTLIAHNDDPATEMIDSVRMGLEAWAGRERIEATDGILLIPGDQPGVAPECIAACVAAFASDPTHVVVATYQGRRGHPLIFPGELITFVESPACDGGLRNSLWPMAAASAPWSANVPPSFATSIRRPITTSSRNNDYGRDSMRRTARKPAPARDGERPPRHRSRCGARARPSSRRS